MKNGMNSSWFSCQFFSFGIDTQLGLHQVCEALLQRNAFINSKTKTGWTSLHYSSMKGYTALVEFLVKKHNATIDSMTIVSCLSNEALLLTLTQPTG